MSSVQDILNEVLDHVSDDASPTRQLAMLNDTVYDIASREPWPFLETTIDLTFDGTNPVPTNWPTDFRAALTVVRTDTGQPLEPIRQDVAYRLHGSQLTEGGDPSAYWFVNRTMHVWPVPAASVVLHMPYLRVHPALVATDLEAAILIPPQHHRAIAMGTIFRLYDMEDDNDLATRFQALYEARIQTMRSELWMRQYDRPDRVYDIDTDLYEYIL